MKTYAVNKVFTGALVFFGVLSVCMVLLGPALVQRFYPLPEDQGSAWYYWQLAQPDFWSRASSWGGYILHQAAVWLLIGLAIKNKAVWGRKDQVNRYNLLILLVNGFFSVLHLIQTQLFYDGIAQDVPIWTSQGSVIVMLVFLLYMMIPVRGLIFGRKFQPPHLMMKGLQGFHGIFISWALVYTFWFHPMEGNWGLMSGFLYMFLLFIQMSMFDTRLHFNKSWIVLLEAGVTIHGTLITIYKDNPIWPMFFFGFLAMFVFTQQFSWKKPRWLSALLIAGYIGGAILVYGRYRGLNHLYELSFIPVALYGGALGLLGLGWILDKAVAARKV